MMTQAAACARWGPADSNLVRWWCSVRDSWLFHVLRPSPPPNPSFFFYNYFKREENWDESAAEVIWRACCSASNAVFICNVNDSNSHLNKPPPPAAGVVPRWWLRQACPRSFSLSLSLSVLHCLSLAWSVNDRTKRCVHVLHQNGTEVISSSEWVTWHTGRLVKQHRIHDVVEYIKVQGLFF